jgi:hypothetical protein
VVSLNQTKGKQVTELELEEMFDEMLDESNELVKIGTLTYLPSQVLKNTDPIAYRIAKYDFADFYLDEEDEDEEDE